MSNKESVTPFDKPQVINSANIPVYEKEIKAQTGTMIIGVTITALWHLFCAIAGLE